MSGCTVSPKELKRPTQQTLDQINPDFPKVAELPALAKSMVQIDQHWDHLTLIKKSNWQTPKGHPDLDGPHEALQLWEHYRELARSPEMQKRPG